MRKFPVIRYVENIIPFIECISMIKCSKCNVIETIALDADEAAEQFIITGGWKATAKSVYCPKCAKKYIK